MPNNPTSRTRRSSKPASARPRRRADRRGEGGAPLASDEAVRERMQRQRRRDTGCERQIRSGLHRLGWRYRVDHQPIRDLRRRADVVFTRLEVAVFVDGCFWHLCKTHRRDIRRNESWWNAKRQRNWERDRDTERRLAANGWLVVRVWEHVPASRAVAVISSILQLRKERRPQMGGLVIVVDDAGQSTEAGMIGRLDGSGMIWTTPEAVLAGPSGVLKVAEGVPRPRAGVVSDEPATNRMIRRIARILTRTQL